MPAPHEARDNLNLIAQLGTCEVEHQGLLLDLGSPQAAQLRGFSLTPLPDTQDIEREGSTFVRTSRRELRYDFWLNERLERAVVSVRVHGGAARALSAMVDDRRVGTAKLPSDETKVIALPALSDLERGHHRIKLALTGGGRSQGALAELDWIRIGPPDDELASYAAPTARDIVGDVVLDSTPKNALVLRAPSTVRCWLRPAADARLQVALGFWGAGKGTAELRILVDGQEPAVAQSRKVAGGDGAVWTPVNLELGAYSDKVIGIEFRAAEGSREGRVAFGEPRIVRDSPSAIVPPVARVSILVIASSLDKHRIPPWGATGRLAALGELARDGATFSAYRAPNAVAASVIASLFTGLPARVHGLEQPGTALSPAVHLVSENIKEASGRSAFFTGVPVTFAPFGFNRGWDDYEMVSPVLDAAAGEPFERAEKWLERELDDPHVGPRLLVVHTRGFHPPWDVSRDELQGMKPDEYGGLLDARRAGITLGTLRNRKRGLRRLQDDDWVRLRALEDVALAKQDLGLERLVLLLKRKNAWDSSLIVFMGDVAGGEPPELPFDPRGSLTEDRLAVPLIAKFPSGELAGREVVEPIGFEDIAATLFNSLGLPLPPRLIGAGLYERASNRVPVVASPLIATGPARYATRLGAWLLRGELGKVPALCALDIDPSCAVDVFDQRSFAARALWVSTFAFEQAAQKARVSMPAGKPAELDPATIAALTVWGDLR
jgi:hypothetical protein